MQVCRCAGASKCRGACSKMHARQPRSLEESQSPWADRAASPGRRAVAQRCDFLSLRHLLVCLEARCVMKTSPWFLTYENSSQLVRSGTDLYLFSHSVVVCLDCLQCVLRRRRTFFDCVCVCVLMPYYDCPCTGPLAGAALYTAVTSHIPHAHERTSMALIPMRMCTPPRFFTGRRPTLFRDTCLPFCGLGRVWLWV